MKYIIINKLLNIYRLVICVLFSLALSANSHVFADEAADQLDPTTILISVSAFEDVNIRAIKPIESNPAQGNSSVLSSSLNFAAQIDQNLPQNEIKIEENQNDNIERLLQQAESEAEKKENKDSAETELKEAIDRVRSVELNPQKEEPRQVFTIDQNDIEPNEVDSKSPLLKTEDGPINSGTLQILRDLSARPGEAVNPYELAEILFLSGYKKEAAVFYQEAFDRKTLEKGDTTDDKAWILFQLANCLRFDNPESAKKIYERIILEYPNSAWVEMSKAYEKLAVWQLQENPRTLLHKKNLDLQKKESSNK